MWQGQAEGAPPAAPSTTQPGHSLIAFDDGPKPRKKGTGTTADELAR